MDCVFKEPAEPSASDLHLLFSREEVSPGYRWNGRFDFARLRRRRQVSLLHGQHQLRTKHRLAGDEFDRSSRAPGHLSGSVKCKRALSVVTRDRRRTAAQTFTSCGSSAATTDARCATSCEFSH